MILHQSTLSLSQRETKSLQNKKRSAFAKGSTNLNYIVTLNPGIPFLNPIILTAPKIAITPTLSLSKRETHSPPHTHPHPHPHPPKGGSGGSGGSGGRGRVPGVGHSPERHSPSGGNVFWGRSSSKTFGGAKEIKDIPRFLKLCCMSTYWTNCYFDCPTVYPPTGRYRAGGKKKEPKLIKCCVEKTKQNLNNRLSPITPLTPCTPVRRHQRHSLRGVGAGAVFDVFERGVKGLTKLSVINNLNTFKNYTQILSIARRAGNQCFWNQTFDKGRLKNFVLWFLKKHGEHKTVLLVEELKNIGFQYATKAGISLGIEDLKIPKKKYSLIMEAEQLSLATIKQYKRGEITGVERFQRLIDTWHRTSERLKQEVIDNFEATDILNPVYMMAFSGARGNISQVRQLVGMRGLMSNPQGQIIDFPIRSNFREGLTLTEYIISSYGARKGIVDTALRTANAGYLTRRLVDVAQHVIISNFDCGTRRGIFLTDMKEGNKTIYSLQNRLIGRVLARDIYNKQKIKIASRNVEISVDLASAIALISKKVFVRSALTCQTKKLVCQLCYGWSLAQGNLVPIGEAVGVVAAQSIGEPGTQLTMRTFHTGGVFSGDVSDQIRAPFDGIVEYNNPIAGTLIRTPEGKIAFLTKNEGSFMVHRLPLFAEQQYERDTKEIKKFKIPFYTLLFLRNGEKVSEKEVIAQISSINRQKNTTDQAELTIKSEFSGQFYSKILDLKENKVGPKLKYTTGYEGYDPLLENAARMSFARKKTLAGIEPPPLSISKRETPPNVLLEDIPTPPYGGSGGRGPSGGRSSSKTFGGAKEIKDIPRNTGTKSDTIFEAWGWGYAWVLSGKIYQLALPSSLFPIFGDYVNQRSYMNQINWNIASSFGASFKLNIPTSTKKLLNKKVIKQMRKSQYSILDVAAFKPPLSLSKRETNYFRALAKTDPGSKTGPAKTGPAPAPFGGQGGGAGLRTGTEQGNVFNVFLEETGGSLMGRASLTKRETKKFKNQTINSILNNSSLLNKKELTLLKTELISFQLSKIIYKKIGYFLKLTEPSSSFCFNKHNFKNYFDGMSLMALPVKPLNTFPAQRVGSFSSQSSQEQSSILSTNDTLFLFSSIFSRKNQNLPFTPSGKKEVYPGEILKNQNTAPIPPRRGVTLNSVYPSNWRPSFDIFLNWFPKRLSTKTGGLIFMEPIFFGQSKKGCPWANPFGVVPLPLPPFSKKFPAQKAFPEGGGEGPPNIRVRLRVVAQSPTGSAYTPPIPKGGKPNKSFLTLKGRPAQGEAANLVGGTGLANHEAILALRAVPPPPLTSSYPPLPLPHHLPPFGGIIGGGEEGSSGKGVTGGFITSKKSQTLSLLSNKINSKSVLFFPTFVRRDRVAALREKETFRNSAEVDLTFFNNKSTLSLSKRETKLNNNSFLKEVEVSSSNYKRIFDRKTFPSHPIGGDILSEGISFGAAGANKSNSNSKRFLNKNSFSVQRGWGDSLVPAKNFVFEQHQQKQFGTVLNTVISANKNKIKSELLTIGLNWKNSFKLNSDPTLWTGSTRGHKHKNAFNIASGLSFKNAVSAPPAAQRIFWISQPFYNIPLKKKKKFFYSYPCITQSVVNGVEPILLQINRQGKIKYFYSGSVLEDHIQINAHTPASYSLDQKYNSEKDCISNQIFKKEGVYYFRGFNKSLVHHLKKRKKVMTSFLPISAGTMPPPPPPSGGSAPRQAAYALRTLYNNGHALDGLISLPPPTLPPAPYNLVRGVGRVLEPDTYKRSFLSLKTFSKISSFPYFLNKKSAIFLRKKLLSGAGDVFDVLAGPVLAPGAEIPPAFGPNVYKKGLFNFYFYSFFNKNYQRNCISSALWLQNLIILLKNKYLKLAYLKNKLTLLKFKNTPEGNVFNVFNVFHGPALREYLSTRKVNNPSPPPYSPEGLGGRGGSSSGEFLSGGDSPKDGAVFPAPKGYKKAKLLGKTGPKVYVQNAVENGNNKSLSKFYKGDNANKNIVISTKAFWNLINGKNNYVVLQKKFKEICSPYLKDQLSFKIAHTQNSLKNHYQKRWSTDYKLKLKSKKAGEAYSEDCVDNRNVIESSAFFSLERKRQLQKWVGGVKFYKKIYLKTMLKKNKKLYALSRRSEGLFKKNLINKESLSAFLKQKRQIQELLRKTPFGIKSSRLYSKKKEYVPSFSQHPLSVIPGGQGLRETIGGIAEKSNEETAPGPFLNIMVKPGWLYYTTNLSNILLYNKKLINPGKSISNDLVFDRHSVFIEIIPFDKIALRASKNYCSHTRKAFPLPPYGGVLKSFALTSIAKSGKDHLHLSSLGGKKNYINIVKTIRNAKCRFEPQNSKTALSLSPPPPYSPEGNGGRGRSLMSSSGAGAVFERETKSISKPLYLRKDLRGIKAAVDGFNDFYPMENEKQPKEKPFFILIRKASEYKLFKDIEHKKEIYKMANQKNNGPALYNLNATMPEGLFSFPRGQLVSLKERLSAASKKRKSLGPNLLNLQKRNIFFESGLTEGNDSKHFSELKWINKSYNSINLYSQYKTGLVNKQKITSQTISKYPSSDLKVFSNISFYSSLSMLKQRTYYSIPPLTPRSGNIFRGNVPLRGLGAGAAFERGVNAGPILENQLSYNKSYLKAFEPNFYLKINKESSWGLPCLPITSIKAINFSPLIISYKAPYTLEFPFKTPMRLFSEQLQHSFLFNNSFNQRQSEGLSFPKRFESGLITGSHNNYLKKVLYSYLFKINSNNNGKSLSKRETNFSFGNIYSKEKDSLQTGKTISSLSSIFACPIVEYSLGKDFEKSISYPACGGNVFPATLTNPSYKDGFSCAGPLNHVDNKRSLSGTNGPLLGSLNQTFEYNNKHIINKETPLYKTEFVSFRNNCVSTQLPFIKTYTYSSFEGELIYRNSNPLNSSESIKNKAEGFIQHCFVSEDISNHPYPPTLPIPPPPYGGNGGVKLEGWGAKGGVKSGATKSKKNYLQNCLSSKLQDQTAFKSPTDNWTPQFVNYLSARMLSFAIKARRAGRKPVTAPPTQSINQNIVPKLYPLPFLDSRLTPPQANVFAEDNLTSDLFANKNINNSCMILTKEDQISFYFPFMQNMKEIYFSLENLKKKNQYVINDIVINFLNILEQNNSQTPSDEMGFAHDNEVSIKINKLPAGKSQQTSKLLIGEFLVYGDQISPTVAIPKSGQIIHINNQKITIRQGQPIFVSPKAVLHKYDGDFIDEQSSVITLSYQQLKTGDIIQGIPKVEQFFEARTTKRGRLFRDSLSNLLKGLFKRYRSKLPLDQAVRQSFYKIQQIIVDGVQRVYRSQGVTIADKHLEVIVKQMTSKVRIIEGGLTGFFPGEIVSLDFIERINSFLTKKILYEPLVLGITKASLEVDSFLSAASFQQTTRVLSKAAISRKKDFLKGLKENVILGNLIPAGTGYLVYLAPPGDISH